MLLTSVVLAALLAVPAPAGPSPTDEPATLVLDSVEWFAGTFEEALKKAGAEDKLLFTYIWTHTSRACNEFQEVTLVDARVAPELKDFVCFGANAVNPDGRALIDRYKVKTLPTILVIDPEGVVEDGIIGVIGPEGFVDEVRRIKRGENTVTALRRRVADTPKIEKEAHIEVLYQLSIKLNDLGNEAGSKGVIDSIRKIDPQGKSEVAARVYMEEARDAAVKPALDEHGDYAGPEAIDLGPMLAFLKKVKHADLAFEGWRWVSGVEHVRENHGAARKAVMTAWNFVPEEQVLNFGNEVAWGFWESREDLSKKEKRFALRISQSACERLTQEAFEGCCEGMQEEERYREEGAGRQEREQEEAAPAPDDTGVAFRKWQAMYLDTLACCYFMNGDLENALATAHKVAELAPDEEEYRKRLASFRADA